MLDPCTPFPTDLAAQSTAEEMVLSFLLECGLRSEC